MKERFRRKVRFARCFLRSVERLSQTYVNVNLVLSTLILNRYFMIIKISDGSKLHSGICLANSRRYYDALCAFVQVDCYESALNRIVCLCAREDIGFAVDLYHFVKQRYPNRSVYADVKSFSPLTDGLLSFCEPNASYARKHDGKIPANRQFLVELPLPQEEDWSSPDLNYAGDSFLFDDPNLSAGKIYDAQSTDYFDSLRVNMEKCFVEGDERVAQKYGNRLLQIETYHLPTLEAQISLVLYTQKYKKGIVFAQRLAQTEGASHAALGGAIEILMRVNALKHLDTLRVLMQKALEIVDEVTLFDLQDYVYVATTLLQDLEMAYKFAKQLYDNRKDCDLEGLKMCACAFFNYGDEALARDAAYDLQRVVPESVYAQILRKFVMETPFAKNQLPLDVPPRVFRHFCMPQKLVVYAKRQLARSLSYCEQSTLDKTAYFYLSVLALYGRSLVLTNQHKDYLENASFLRVVLENLPSENFDDFVEFAKDNLFSTLNDQSLSEILIYRLAEQNFDRKLFVGLTSGYYVLDFSKIHSNDKLFLHSFAVCASLVRIDNVDKFQTAYTALRDCCPKYDDAYKFAYAMLCECVANFEHSAEAEFFDEEKRLLHKRYVARRQNGVQA